LVSDYAVAPEGTPTDDPTPVDFFAPIPVKAFINTRGELPGWGTKILSFSNGFRAPEECSNRSAEAEIPASAKNPRTHCVVHLPIE
jgi:hypothetical protein